VLKKIMMASVAVGALAFNAPIASASGHLDGDCDFTAVQQEETTGQTYQGGAAGYGTNSTGGNVTVHCEVRVNDEVVSTTPPGSGQGAATTAGTVSFTASDTDEVELCAVVTDGTETVKNCDDTTHSEFPPPGTWEQVDALLWSVWNVVDPVVCAELAKLANDYGNGNYVTAEGDVYVNGELFYDCPPYVEA